MELNNIESIPVAMLQVSERAGSEEPRGSMRFFMGERHP